MTDPKEAAKRILGRDPRYEDEWLNGAACAVARAYLDLQAENARMREALEKIASLDDEGANAYLKNHGSYAMFDEPGSVEIARSALPKAMADREVLLRLAERCEREAPNDELNWSIMEAVRPGHGQTQATPYGHSIDAAATLVPEGWVETVGRLCDGSAEAQIYQCGTSVIFYRLGRTPALALCAAALRARAALPDTKEE